MMSVTAEMAHREMVKNILAEETNNQRNEAIAAAAQSVEQARQRAAEKEAAAAGHTTGAQERKVPRREPFDPCNPKVTGPEVYQNPEVWQARRFCAEAAQIVSGDRAIKHGPKERNHKNIAVLWEAYMQLKEANGESARFISSYDVATMMELLKIARRFAGAGRTNADNYVDGVGYCAIAGEIALNAKEIA